MTALLVMSPALVVTLALVVGRWLRHAGEVQTEEASWEVHRTEFEVGGDHWDTGYPPEWGITPPASVDEPEGP